MPAPHVSVHALQLRSIIGQRRSDAGPGAVLVVPGGRAGLGHAGEEKLEHVAVLVAGIGHGTMPQVVVGDGDGAGWRDQGQLPFYAGALGGIEIMAAGHDARGTAFQRRVLRVVEGQQIAGAVRPALAAVLVHGLALAAGGVVVRVPVRLQVIVRADDALQGADHRGMVENLAHEWDPRQEIVSRVALARANFLVLGKDFGVEFRRQIRGDGDVAVGYELGHLSVGETEGLSGHEHFFRGLEYWLHGKYRLSRAQATSSGLFLRIGRVAQALSSRCPTVLVGA